MVKRLGKYKRILVWLFERATQNGETPDEIAFSQADVLAAAEALDVKIGNRYDIPYNLRSRTQLPQVLLEAGFSSIAARGSGEYAITKDDDSVTIPDELIGDVVGIPSEKLPSAIRGVLRADEQSMLSAILYAEVIGQLFNVPAWRLQGHLRTRGSFGQQVEADEVYICEFPEGHKVVPIEAKGPREKLGKSQIRSVIDAVLTTIPGLPVIPLGLQLNKNGELEIVRFEFTQDKDGSIQDVDVVSHHRFRFEPQLPNWPSY